MTSTSAPVLPKRRRGGQPNNTNNLRSGKWSLRLKAKRMAAAQAKWREQEERSRAWAATCPKVDYGRVIDELIKLRQAQEAANTAQGHHLKWSRE